MCHHEPNPPKLGAEISYSLQLLSEAVDIEIQKLMGKLRLKLACRIFKKEEGENEVYTAYICEIRKPTLQNNLP